MNDGNANDSKGNFTERVAKRTMEHLINCICAVAKFMCDKNDGDVGGDGGGGNGE